MGKATNTTEVVVTCPNEIGALAKCTLPLKQNNINVECFCCYPEGNIAKFHFVTNNNTQAKEAWKKAGYTVTENPAVCWTTDNTPGGLTKATSALAEKKIDITYCYCATPPGNKTASVVFCTNNNATAYTVLNNC